MPTRGRGFAGIFGSLGPIFASNGTTYTAEDVQRWMLDAQRQMLAQNVFRDGLSWNWNRRHAMQHDAAFQQSLLSQSTNDWYLPPQAAVKPQQQKPDEWIDDDPWATEG